MRKKIMWGLGVLGIVAGTFAIPSAQAYQGDPTKQGPNHSSERHAAMEKAFETSDYNAWKSLTQGRGRVAQTINETNFAEFAKAHMLLEQGKKNEAIVILRSLGLAQNNGNGLGNGSGRAGHGQKGTPRSPTNRTIKNSNP